MKKMIRVFATLICFMVAVSVMGGLHKILAAESSLAEFNFDASGKMTGDKLAEYGDKDGYNSTYGRGMLLCYMDNSGPRALEWSDPEYNYNGVSIVPIVRASIKNKWGNTPSFLISFSTRGYTSVRFSAMLAGSSNGPAKWKLQYSTDGVSFTDISASDITIPFDTRKLMTSYYNGFALPQEVSDRDIVYIRIIASSTATVAGGDYLQLPSGGETAINGIRIVGTDIASITTAPPPPVTTAQETTKAAEPNTTKGQQTTTKGQQATTAGQQGTTKTGTSGGNDATTAKPGNTEQNGTDGETVRPHTEISTHIVTQTNASGETITSIVYDETTEALTDENGETVTDNESESAEESEKESPDEKKSSKTKKKTATSGNVSGNNEGTAEKNGSGLIVISLLAAVLAAGIAAAVIIQKRKSRSDD